MKNQELRERVPFTLLSVALCFALGTVGAIATQGSTSKIPVILTTDCGTDVDDQWTVAYLFISPEFDIKGVVTTHAPNLPAPSAEASAKCVLDVLRRLGISPPPVFPGSSVALKNKTPLINEGVNFIVSTSRRFSQSNRLRVLTIGATTDVASALLVDPKLGDRIEVLTMGFDSWPKGGDSWNIRNDALAYKFILESSAPITVGDADICKKTLNLDANAARKLVGDRGEVGHWLAEILAAFITKYEQMVARAVGPGQWAIWDNVVIAHMLDFTQTETYARPGLNVNDFTFLKPQSRQPTITWVTALDKDRMWQDFVSKLERHNARTTRQGR
jgi:inosine-uridine nucleoside N-ribohydrolase